MKKSIIKWKSIEKESPIKNHRYLAIKYDKYVFEAEFVDDYFLSISQDFGIHIDDIIAFAEMPVYV
jgi:hypothetical protein